MVMRQSTRLLVNGKYFCNVVISDELLNRQRTVYNNLICIVEQYHRSCVIEDISTKPVDTNVESRFFITDISTDGNIREINVSSRLIILSKFKVILAFRSLSDNEIRHLIMTEPEKILSNLFTIKKSLFSRIVKRLFPKL